MSKALFRIIQFIHAHVFFPSNTEGGKHNLLHIGNCKSGKCSCSDAIETNLTNKFKVQDMSKYMTSTVSFNERGVPQLK